MAEIEAGKVGEQVSGGGTGVTHTVMFTDLAASTATTQRLGDASAQDLVRTHNDIVRTARRARPAVFQSRTLPSSLAEASRLPSGLKVTLWTAGRPRLDRET